MTNNMTNTKAPTKKENFSAVLAILKEWDQPNLVAFIEHEIELLNKKSASRSGKKSDENENIKTAICEALTEVGEPIRLTDLLVKYPALGSQNKVNAMLKQLKDDGIVERIEEKKVAKFTMA